MPLAIYQTLGEYLAESDDRLRSPELDFGVHWRDARDGQWRVSWVERTGEVYAVRLGPSRIGEPSRLTGLTPEQERIILQHGGTASGPVLVLGIVPGREAIEAVLEGWADACGRESVRWIVDRLSAGAVAVRDGRTDSVQGTETAGDRDAGDVGP